MKKFLVVLLALAMVFAFASIAYAEDVEIDEYSDLGELDDDIAIAIYRLSALGVLEGYGDLTFAPDRNITRAEFAKIAVLMSGEASMVDLYATFAPAFPDVTNDYWAKGYINVAAELGIMKGYEDGTFRAQNMVTMQEVATVLLRIAGYDDNLPGDWPLDYNRKAVNSGLAKYIEYVGPTAASRAEVASMANQILGFTMVMYVENEIAQGLSYVGVIEGLTVDADGYIPRYYYTNEDDRDLDGRSIETDNVLWYAFGAYTADVQFNNDVALANNSSNADNAILFSERAGWGFEHFADWELQAYTIATYDQAATSGVTSDFTVAATDFASRYSIYGGSLVDLAGRLAEVTVFANGSSDDEICFVEFDGSVVELREVVKDGSIFADIESDVDDYDPAIGAPSAGLTNASDLPINQVLADPATAYASTGYFFGKIYLDGDGDYYDYKDYDQFIGTRFGVYSYTRGNVIYLNGDVTNNIAQIDVTDRMVIWKDGAWVEHDALVAGDVIYYAGKINANSKGTDGGVELYLVYSPQAAQLEKVQTSYVQVDGVVYGALDEATTLNGGYDRYISTNNGENFDAYHMDSVFDVFGTDVLFVRGYDFANMAYFTADLDVVNYGVIHRYVYEAQDSRDGRYDILVGVRVYTPDGELTTFNFDKEYPYGTYAEVAAATVQTPDLFDIPALGSIASFYLNSDGEITKFSDNASDWHVYGGTPVGTDAEINNAKTGFKYANRTYRPTENSVNFLVTFDGDDYDPSEPVTIITTADLLAGDFEAAEVFAWQKNAVGGEDTSISSVGTLYIVNHGGAAGDNGLDFYTGERWGDVATSTYQIELENAGWVDATAALFGAIGSDDGMILYTTRDGKVNQAIVLDGGTADVTNLTNADNTLRGNLLPATRPIPAVNSANPFTVGDVDYQFVKGIVGDPYDGEGDLVLRLAVAEGTVANIGDVLELDATAVPQIIDLTNNNIDTLAELWGGRENAFDNCEVIVAYNDSDEAVYVLVIAKTVSDFLFVTGPETVTDAGLGGVRTIVIGKDATLTIDGAYTLGATEIHNYGDLVFGGVVTLANSSRIFGAAGATITFGADATGAVPTSSGSGGHLFYEDAGVADPAADATASAIGDLDANDVYAWNGAVITSAPATTAAGWVLVTP